MLGLDTSLGIDNDHSSLFSLVANASIVVQLILIILLVASVLSWSMIFYKWLTLRVTIQSSSEFEDKFWSSNDLPGMYKGYLEVAPQSRGMVGMFISGFREFTRLTKDKDMERGMIVNGVNRVMQVSVRREIESLETGLSFLATVGSTSPYIGLLGTVWGIMNSFRAIGALNQVTINTVAPGIAEALIATAMGLFAAIPAVIAYNRFTSQVDRQISRCEVFMEEFLSIVHRQAYKKSD